MAINLIILVAFFIGFICSGIESSGTRERKKGLGWMFDRLGEWIISSFSKAAAHTCFGRRINGIVVRKWVEDDLKALHPSDRGEGCLNGYYRTKLSIVLAVLFVSNLLALMACITEITEEQIADAGFLERNEFGGGVREEEYYVSIEGEVEDEPFRIELEERKYTDEEAVEALKKAMNEMDKVILGDNVSKDEVRSNLNLVSQIPGTPITVSWETDNSCLIDGEGHIEESETRKEGTLVKITGMLKYEEHVSEYSTYVRILPEKKTEKEELLAEIRSMVEAAEISSGEESKLELPDEVGSRKIQWKKKTQDYGAIITLAGIMAGFAIFAAKDRELRQQMEKRRKQMLIDYPDIVSKLTLLLGAGMTIKGAWQKIVLDYREKKDKNPAMFRYAYEEMLVTYYEMQGGVMEARAYDDFGKRCRIQRYLKLSTLLIQNMKKGSRGLEEMLGAEADDAFEERKARAKSMGEEAGTKLLIPMFMMLAIVLIIVVVPAFLSFRI